MDEVIAQKHIQVLVRLDSSGRTAPRPGWTGGRYSWMRTVLAADHGKGLYRKRMQMIEPVFGHTKHNGLITRFHRRGRTAVARRVAVTDGNPQPDQAPPPPARHRRGLKTAPAAVEPPKQSRDLPTPNPTPPTGLRDNLARRERSPRRRPQMPTPWMRSARSPSPRSCLRAKAGI